MNYKHIPSTQGFKHIRPSRYKELKFLDFICIIKKCHLIIHNFRENWSRSKVNLQSFTKYLRQTLVFMWNSALQEKFKLPKILGLKAFGNSWGNSYIPVYYY